MKVSVWNIERWMIKHIRKFFEIHDIRYFDIEKLKDMSNESPLIFSFDGTFSFTEIGHTLDLIQMLLNFGKIRKIVFLSAYNLYFPKNGKYKEQDPIFPKNRIGSQVAIIENALMYFSEKYDTDITVLRIFNTYGPFQLPPYVIPSLLESAINGSVINIGDLDKIRDFVYVDDVIEALKKVANMSKSGLRIYNIGSGKGTSIRELINMIKKITQKNIEVVFDASRLREEYDHDYVVADIEKAKEELAWEPKVDLEEGLRLTYQWLLGRSDK